jgi:type I restriction enzyme S subunit
MNKEPLANDEMVVGNCGLRKGYKQAEVGIIPEDWDVKPLMDFATIISDGIHATPKYVHDSNFFFVNGNNLVNDEIAVTAATMCVSEAEYKSLKKPLTDQTLLFSINGTIGNLAFYKGDSVNSADVKALDVYLPIMLEEQTAIATVLSDMDTEITALETRRDKTRDLKQGMMQELLTGRIRLV